MNPTQKSIMWLEAIAIIWILGSTTLGIGIFDAITKNLLSIQSIMTIAYGLIAIVYDIFLMKKKVWVVK